jgi:hypothetical protein
MREREKNWLENTALAGSGCGLSEVAITVLSSRDQGRP